MKLFYFKNPEQKWFDEQLHKLEENVNDLKTVIEELNEIRSKTIDTDIEYNTRMIAYDNNLKGLSCKIGNLEKDNIPNKDIELAKLDKEFVKINEEIKEIIDPLTIDLLISAEKIAKNE